MQKVENLVELLEKQGLIEGKGIVFISETLTEKFISYKHLYIKSMGLLSQLQEIGLGPGCEVIFQIEDNEQFVCMFWACILGGIIPVTAPVGNNEEHKLRILKMWSILVNPYLFTNEKLFAHMKAIAQANSMDGLMEEIGQRTILAEGMKDRNISGKVHRSGPDDLAVVQFSSGSTGDPKGVALTHRNLLSNIDAIIICSEQVPEDSTLSWMPLTHGIGLIGFHLTPLAAGINQYLMPPSSFIRNPLIWMRKVGEYKVSLTSSPNFGFKYFLSHLKNAPGIKLDLSELRLIYNGAEPVSADLCNSFLHAMSDFKLKRNVMFPVYGMAEASLAISFPPVGDELVELTAERNCLSVGHSLELSNEKNNLSTVTFVDLGHAVKGCEIRICNEKNEVLGENVIGSIQIKGDNVTKGYYKNPLATEEAYTRDGWLITGDLGFLRNNRLTVTGRAKDIIFINGQNFFPYDVERIAENACDIGQGKIAAVPVFNKDIHKEEIVLFVVSGKPQEEFAGMAVELKKSIFRQIGLEVRSVVPVKEIPRTSSGKAQRYKLAEMYNEGRFDRTLQIIESYMSTELENKPVDSPQTETERILMNICSEVLGNDRLGLNDNFIEFGGNSILLTKMHARLEELYPKKLSIANLFSYPTISRLARFIDCDRDITIESVKMPEEFFNVEGGGMDTSTLEFEITGKQFANLKNMSVQFNIELKIILLSAYLYTLSQESGSKSVSVGTALTATDTVIPFSIDFETVEGIHGLFGAVRERLISQAQNSYSLQDMDAIKPGDTPLSITTIFYAANCISGSAGLLSVYDIAFEADESSEKICLYLSYNHGRVKDESAGRLLKTYIKLLDLLSDRYENINKLGTAG